MKKSILATILCIACVLSLFSACSNTDKKETPPAGSGTYTDYTGGDKTIAVQAGDVYDPFVREQGWCKDPLLFQTISDAAEAVRLGRADAAMITRDAVAALEESGVFRDLEFLPVPEDVIKLESAPVFHDQQLAAQFNTFLSTIAADGTLEEMHERYLRNGLPKSEDIPQIELTGKNGTLRVTDTGDYPPMSYVANGEVQGFDVELVRRFAAYLEMDLHIELLNYDAVLPSVVSGNTDMSACCYTVTEERQKSTIFGNTVIAETAVMAVRKQGGATTGTALTYQDYMGKRFSILTGSVFDKIADDTFAASEKFYFNSVVEEIEAVNLGKTDAALVDAVIATQSLGTGQYPDITTVEVPIPDLDLEYGVFSTKQEIITQYNAFLAEIEADGTLKEMQNRWLTTYSLETPMPEIALTGKNGTLQVAVTATYPPFIFSGDSGKLVGFDIEQLTRFAAWLGMDIKFTEMEFGSLLTYVASGKADLGGSVYATAERKESFHFGNPDYVSKTVLVVKNKQAAARDYTWFAGKKVGANIGAVTDSVLEDIGAVPAYYQETTDGFEDVRNGRIDGFALDYSNLRAMAAEKQNEDMEVFMIPQSYFAAPVSAVAALDNQALIDEFNAFLALIEQDGTLDEMKTRWLEEIPDENTEMPALHYSGEKGVLRVATTGTNTPFEYYGANDELKGYCIELTNRFAAHAGYTVAYSGMDFGSIIPAVVGGKADLGMSNISITEERKKSVLFTDAFFTDTFAIIALKETAAQGESEKFDFIAWLKTSIERNLIAENRWKMVVDGLGVTMLIALLSQLLGTLLGSLLTFILTRKNRFVNGLGRFYSGFIHGLPIVVLLMISYYIIFGQTEVSSVWIAVCAFAFVEAVNIAANLTGAIGTVDKTEIEAARSIGFSAMGAFRTVTLPQAIKRAFPGYCDGFIELVKATAVVGYIAIQDLTRAGDIIRSRTYDAFFPLLMVAVIYLIVTTLCVQLFKFIVRKLNKEVA